MKKGKKGIRRRRKIRAQGVIVLITVFSVLLYLGSRVFLNSKTLAMSMENQDLLDSIANVQNEVDDLQKEIQNLETRSTVLGKVDTGIRDIPDNIVIIDQD